MSNYCTKDTPREKDGFRFGVAVYVPLETVSASSGTHIAPGTRGIFIAPCTHEWDNVAVQFPGVEGILWSDYRADVRQLVPDFPTIEECIHSVPLSSLKLYFPPKLRKPISLFSMLEP